MSVGELIKVKSEPKVDAEVKGFIHPLRFARPTCLRGTVCWRGVSVGDSKVSVDSTRVSCVNSSASVAWQRKKNLWIPWILCEIKTYQWATFPPPAIRTERWKVKVFLSTPSPLRGTPPVSEGESERKGERRNETCEVWCHQDSVLWCLAPKSIIILLARLGLLIVRSLWVPRA